MDNAPRPEKMPQPRRRWFLREAALAAAGAAAALTVPNGMAQGAAAAITLPNEMVQGAAAAARFAAGGEGDPPRQGRVLDNSLAVHKEPSFDSPLVNMYWRDVVFPIDAVTIGDREPAYNRVWYRVNGEGYAHSGSVQPVALTFNAPAAAIPKTGLLAEISVPFTDALWDPNRPDRVALRLYFNSVHWLTAIERDRTGRTWYRVPDDKIKKAYYVNAAHARALTADELAPLAAGVPAQEKRIEVRLGEQVVVAYEGSRAVFMARAATGGRFIEGDFSTPTGRFYTNRKRPSRHMASSDLAAPSAFDLPGVPWVTYLTLSGISFHGTYWHNDFGKPRSHGCINLSPRAAKWIYRWTDPPVPYEAHTWAEREGTAVDIVA